MKKLYSASDRFLLNLLRSKLEGEDIEVLMKNENPPAAGELPPVIAWPELWVMDDEQFPKAEKILRSELEKRASASTELWQCPKCGEQLEIQFTICWKCGYAK